MILFIVFVAAVGVRVVVVLLLKLLCIRKLNFDDNLLSVIESPVG